MQNFSIQHRQKLHNLAGSPKTPRDKLEQEAETLVSAILLAPLKWSALPNEANDGLFRVMSPAPPRRLPLPLPSSTGRKDRVTEILIKTDVSFSFRYPFF